MPKKEASNQIRLDEAVINIGSGLSLTKGRDNLQPKNTYTIDSISSASTVIPIADNELDTAIRTGLVGVSLNYARADHNHPIRRQGIPAIPTITAFGTGMVITNQTNNGSVSDEESVTFFITLQVTQTISNAWNGFNVPNIAGFQRAEVVPTGCYRNIGNLTGYRTAPCMNIEWSYYFNGTAYMNVPNRNVATSYFISFKVKYTRT